MKKILLSALYIISGSVLWAQNSVFTYPTIAANNGFDQVLFELTTTQPIQLDSIANVFNVGSGTADVWVRLGGYSNPPQSVTTANGWTMISSTPITSTSNTLPTTIPTALNYTLLPGQTYGFSVHALSVGTRYHSHVAADPTTYTDGTVTLTIGPVKGWGGAFPTPGNNPRDFVGGIYYSNLSSSPNDGGVSAILEPSSACAGMYDVVVRINNYGINQISTMNVEWTLNGNQQTTYTHSTLLDTINGTGPSSAAVTIGTVSLTGGNSDTIKVWTDIPNNQQDTSNLNDTTMEIYNSLSTISAFPYIEDYESGQAGWMIGGTNSTWAFGTPAKSNIMGASSGDSAFVTGGLTGNYNNSEQSHVSSPCFDVSGFEGTGWVSLDVNWDTEFSWDGSNLQISDDGGVSWSLVGDLNDPNNWYNDATITGAPGGSQIGWSGSGTSGSGGWIQAKHMLDLSNVSGPIRFRVNFGSDGSVNSYQGFAFDNFIIVDFKEADLGDQLVSKCGETDAVLDPDVNFNGTIEWSTGDTINETITVTDTGIYWVLYTDTLLDLTTGDTIKVIQTAPPSINFSSAEYTIPVDGQITLDPQTSFGLTYDWQPNNWTFPYLLLYATDLGLGEHNYTLTVTDSLGCMDVQSVKVTVVDFTGIEKAHEASVKYYPNPVEDVLNLELEGFKAEPMTIRIMDMQGRVVATEIVQNGNGELITLNVGQLTKGSYILNIQGESQQAVARIVVE